MTHYHEHYDHYNPEMILRLDGFYGRVENSIHQNILKYVTGKDILEIGCGFGSLTHFLKTSGFNALGIDQHEPSVKAGQKRFPNTKICLTKENLESLPEQGFDTIIMKDVIHHVYDEDDINIFLKQVKRLCRQRLIIVDPNPTFILKLCRMLIKHDDPICPPKEAIFYLEKNGFTLKKLFFSEFMAFPLSGGFIGPEWIRSAPLQKCILKIDALVNTFFRFLKIDRLFCWRYYIIADLS